MSRRTLFLLLLILLFATRAALVLADADVFFYGDELAKGTASKGLLDDVGVPRWQLDYVYHEGGGLIVIHLNALLFALFGPSVLAHKVAALVTTSILLAVGLRMATEHFGRKAGVIFGLLFVLCPASFLRYSLISIGTHFEAVILAALVLHHATRLAVSPPGAARDWLLLGLASGLGIYFSLQTAAAVAAAGLALVAVHRRGILGRGLLLGALGFAVGGIPLWIMMSHVGTRAVVVQAHTNFSGGLRGWAAAKEWLHPLFRDPDLGSWVRAAAFAAVIPAGLRLGSGPERARLRSRSGLILLYLALFVLLYAGSGFALAHDQQGLLFWLRSSSLWFFGTMLFSACAAALLEGGARAPRELAMGAVALMVVAGLASFASLLRTGRPTQLADNWPIVSRTRGYDYIDYFDKYKDHFEGSLADRLPRLLAFRDEPDFLLPAAVHSLLDHSGLDLERALEFVRARFPDQWETAALGLGLEIAPDYGHDLGAAFAAIDRCASEARPALAEALGRVALGLKITAERIDQASRFEAPPPLRDDFLRGVGWRIHRLNRLRPDRALAMIGNQPASVRPALLAGYARARDLNTLP